MTFREKLNSNYYSANLDRPCVVKPKKPEFLDIDPLEWTPECYTKLEEYKVELAAYDNIWNEWRKKVRELTGRLDEEFEKDLAEYHGVSDHPKRGKLYGVAYQMGHAYGNNEIANYYADLVELVKD